LLLSLAYHNKLKRDSDISSQRASRKRQRRDRRDRASACLPLRIKERGGLTILLGTDDENDQTTPAGCSLFPNVYEHIAHIRNLKQPPYAFYQQLGYVFVGVIPDANGLKPDILMTKSLVW
jgi:hypothetical protein